MFYENNSASGLSINDGLVRRSISRLFVPGIPALCLVVMIKMYLFLLQITEKLSISNPSLTIGSLLSSHVE